MKGAQRTGVRELARLFRVETSYENMDGGTCRADTRALVLTLRALGAEMDDATGTRAALRARRAELAVLPIQPVQVAWDGALPSLRVRLQDNGTATMAIELRLESGNVITRQYDARPVPARSRGGWTATHALHLSERLPLGYHTIQVETPEQTFETFVIAAPRRGYAPPDVREWGVFFPLHAVSSERSWGVGDYSDLERAARWIGGLGGGFVSTLPLLATFLDAPFEPSPYSPASRLFWNELFVDVTAVPGWTPGPDGIDDCIAACRAGELVDYHRTAGLKRRELERARRAAGQAGLATGMDQFVAARPLALEYARFRAVCDRRRAGWSTWPARLRDGTIRDSDYAPEDRDYHIFAQWQADVQLARLGEARDEGAASLYLDMPLGVNPDGFDSWRYRQLFAENISAGAPPDPLFTAGQNWGFRPLLPGALQATGYRYLIDTFRHHLRHARMLRLDHVMSMYRLFWVPDGVAARDGVYVRYPEDELFAVLALESARHRAVMVGEDLGTVPPAVRRAMDRHAVHRLHVLQFEASAETEPPVSPPPAAAVASLNTHDMPTFAGFWWGSDIDDQLDLGLIDEAAHDAALQQRAVLRDRLSHTVGAGAEIDPGLARQRLLERLAESAARYVLINLEDLWLEERPQNVPGTSHERPNWRRRARRTLTEIMADASMARMLRAIGERRRNTPMRPENHG